MGSPTFPEFLSLHCPVSNLRFLPGKTTVNHVSKIPGRFFKGVLLASEVNLNSLKLSGPIQVYACLSQMTFQSLVIWLVSNCGLLLSSHRTYVNKHIAIKIKILNESFWSLEGLVRGKKLFQYSYKGIIYQIALVYEKVKKISYIWKIKDLKNQQYFK